MTRNEPPVAVIGAGFSGTMTALHLLSHMPSRTILLVERADRFARGAAYGTDDPGHLLNVRASNMSAFPDRPDDFLHWLDRSGHWDSPQVRATPAGVFVSRQLYGRYLTGLLEAAVSDREGASRLILVPDEAVDLVPEGAGFRLDLAGGLRHEVAGAVLAAGNLLPASGGEGPYVANPWEGSFAEGLDPATPVVVVGSGLTMVDVVLRLRHAGFEGPVVAISRHGLLPQTHAPTVPWALPAFDDLARLPPSALLRRLRAEAARAEAHGTGWRGVVDGLRAVTSALWQGFDEAGRGRFLRHARPWWDVHRHRMAPPVGEQIAALLAAGQLTVEAGRIETIVTAGAGATVTYRPRGGSATRTIEAQRVVNATGTAPPDHCGNMLVERLIGRGLARLDQQHLGLDLTAGFALVAGDGAAVPRLWALGPLGRGIFWECVAVPDIRQQAADVAGIVSAALDHAPA